MQIKFFFAMAIAVVGLTGAFAQGADPVLVTIQETSARPGDRVLIPVEISGVEGREIVSGEVKVKFDPVVLAGIDVVDRGSLIGNQRWLKADQIDSSAADFHVFQAVFAASEGFTRNGDLLFLEFEVNSEAAIGTTTTLEVIDASFNNGEPLATLGSGIFQVVSQVVRANFVGRPRWGSVPLEVHFFENSSGEIETYAWDFGDNGSSDEANPVHVYTEPGTYTVSLTVAGPEGSATEEKEEYIEAQPDSTAPEIINGPKAVDVKQDRATILWITNEDADGFVEYTTIEGFPESDSVRVVELTRQHRIDLTGLEADTRYFYRVQSTDAAGNSSRFKRGLFHTKKNPDNKPPVITKGPAAEEVTDQSATILWRTNEVSTSIVEYATLEDFSDPVRAEDDELVEDHQVALSGLDASTRYFFRVRSVDSDGNASAFKLGTFKTKAAPDGTPPVILFGPVAIGRTHQSVTIKWVTDEAASSRVDYGLGTDYDLSQVEEGRRRVHLVRLTNLESSTLYHAQVTSVDAAGNQTVSGDFEFITRSKPDIRWPRIVLRPYVLGRFLDRLVIRWETDEPCAGVVEYGPDGEYGSTARSEEEGRIHTAVLTDLDEDREYRFRVSVTDQSSNGPVFSEEQAGRTLAAIKPLEILQGPIVVNRGENRVTIRWRTNRPADSFVDYGATADYGERMGSTELGVDHEVIVSGLEAATAYHARVVSTDPDEQVVESGDLGFTTRSVADVQEPFITRGPEVVGLTDSSAFVAWKTNEPADATVEYGNDLNYGETIFLEDFEVDHRVSLTGLEPGKEYHFRISFRDRAGNGPVTSNDVSFRTLARQDIEPPAIVQGPGIGDVQSGQVTIVWRTDEPADSFVDYGESTGYGNRAGDAALVRAHEVTLSGLNAGTEYHYRVSSTDLAGNRSTTDPAGSAKWSRDLTFRTRKEKDSKPPAIVRGPLIIASGRSALIRFTTDEPCIARLAYGTAQTLGTADEEVVYENEASVRHDLRIGHLKKKTRYVFKLTCQDAAGNVLEIGSGRRAKVVPLTEAGDFAGALEFSTEEEEDLASPVIVEGPSLLSRTADTAIICWKTDEPASSAVDFGTGELAQMVSDAEYVQEHSVYLTGLEAGTTYSYQVRSVDFAGNAVTVSQILGFTTELEADLTPPKLVAAELVSADIGQAIIRWTTDEPTSTQLVYGAGGELDLIFFEEEFASEHQAVLTGLAAATAYEYQLSFTDASGNGPVTSEQLSFTTAAAADATPPQLEAVGLEQVGDASAIVSWTTDEPASSFVHYGTDEGLDLSAGDGELTTEHRVTLTNLEVNTGYRFQVESIDLAGNRSVLSTVAEFTTLTEPDAEAPVSPSVFSARIGLDTAILSWSSSAAADLAGYTLYRQIRTGGFEPVATGLADTFYVDQGLVFGTPYTYYVAAVDLNGNESDPSIEQGGTPSIRNVPGSVSPLGVQTWSDGVTLTVSNAVPSSSGGELTYTFHVSSSELFDDIVASGSGVVEGSGSTSWTFAKELVAGEDYFWRARAADGLFDGPWSFPSFFVAEVVEKADPGDFNGDKAVTFDDFFLFADAFGTGEGEVGYDALKDLSGNGRIDFDDFFLFADVFGTVYSTSRPAVVDRVTGELPLVVRSHLDKDELLVELRAVGAEGWRGLGLLMGYDPAVLELVDGEEEADFGRDLSSGLQIRVPTDDDAVVLLAHRTSEAPFSGEGSVAFLRFRRLTDRAETWLELRAGAVQTTEEVVHLANPRSLRVRLVPERFALSQNFPNPFNPETTIRFDLPVDAEVRLELFDVLGQRVRTLASGWLSAGGQRVVWDGRDEAGSAVGNGVYFYRLQADAWRSDALRSADLRFVQVRRMLLLK
jgi:PKD repeat protein